MKQITMESVTCTKCGQPRIGDRTDGYCSHCGLVPRTLGYEQSTHNWMTFLFIVAVIGIAFVAVMLIREVTQ